MKTDILVIGGSAAGFVAASTAKLNNPEKHVLMIRQEEIVMIPCGIPYIFGTTGSSEKNILPDKGLEAAGVELMIDEVVTIDCQEKKCETATGKNVEFEKLIIATGSTPYIPKWLKGAELKNVYTIAKNKNYLDMIQEEIVSKSK